MRPKFEVHRMVPGSGMAGEPMLYRLTIRNLSPKRYSSLAAFEDSSNTEVLRIPPATVPDLPPSGAAEVTAQITPLRRGKLNLTSVTICVPDLLGIARRPQKLTADSSILILPKRYPVPRINLPGNRKYQPGGVALSSSIGESLEFESLRDYRPGDP